jgi:hypothetical protein
MARLALFFAILLISGLIRSAPLAAQTSDLLTASRTTVGGPQLAERVIVCGSHRGCRALREGCRLMRAPHPRDNRVACNQARAT